MNRSFSERVELAREAKEGGEADYRAVVQGKKKKGRNPAASCALA
jgi:hypothetical protein